MCKIFGLTAILLAGVLAMPMDALAQQKHGGSGGGGGHAAPRGGGGGSGGHFSGGGSGGAVIHAAPAFRAPAPHYSVPVQRSAPPVVRAPTHVAPTVRIAPSRVTPQFSTTTRSHIGRANIQPQTSTAGQLRVQQRQERVLRRAEIRQLRSLPPSQRAVRRLEIQNARRLRAQQRLQVQTGATTQTQVRALRRGGQPHVTTHAARQGRFASAFAANTSARHDRFAHTAAHRAWRHGHRAIFVPWYGPVFWPYAYSDVFDYAFWPYGYDDGYWFYAYDNFFDGVFWGGYGPPEDYSYAYAAPSAPRTSYAGAQELCNQPGTGVTAWPFAEIERKVGLNDEQKQLLSDVRKAGSDAAASFKASCPAESAFPLTPPGRLAAMTVRLDATLQAVHIVRPALVKFYDSLSDEQKARFNQIGPKKPTSAEASQASVDAKSCTEQKPGLTNLPIERIKDAAKPTDAQQASLKGLEDATATAVSILQAACPDDTPITPPGRLEAMEKRLQAMIDAANTVKPALDTFYGALSAEQKARFNRLGQTLAQEQL